MKPNQLTMQGLPQSSFKALVGSVITSILFTGISAWATPSTPPLLCFTDKSGTVTQTNNLTATTPAITTAVTTTAAPGQLVVQFYELDPPRPVGLPTPNPSFVELTTLGVPTIIVSLDVFPLVGQDSVTVAFYDNTSANWATELGYATAQPAPQVANTPGVSQDLSPYIADTSLAEWLQICVGCGTAAPPVPDSGSTLALLGLGLAGVALVYRRMPRSASVVR